LGDHEDQPFSANRQGMILDYSIQLSTAILTLNSLHCPAAEGDKIFNTLAGQTEKMNIFLGK